MDDELLPIQEFKPHITLGCDGNYWYAESSYCGPSPNIKPIKVTAVSVHNSLTEYQFPKNIENWLTTLDEKTLSNLRPLDKLGLSCPVCEVDSVWLMEYYKDILIDVGRNKTSTRYVMKYCCLCDLAIEVL